MAETQTSKKKKDNTIMPKGHELGGIEEVSQENILKEPSVLLFIEQYKDFYPHTCLYLEKKQEIDKIVETAKWFDLQGISLCSREVLKFSTELEGIENSLFSLEEIEVYMYQQFGISKLAMEEEKKVLFNATYPFLVS